MSNRRPYIQQQSASWWLKNPFFVRYMIREGTSIFAAAYSLVLIWGLFSLTKGEQAFVEWLNCLASPGMVIFHGLALISTMIHAVTWFKLTPKIVPIQFGRFAVPDKWMIAGQYLGFGLVSLVIILLASVWF